jgi:CelD/BcsL family acetyltransferase involved in cellulose biosynthesis
VLRRAELAGGSDSLISSRHRRDLRRLARRLGEELGAPLELSDVSGRAAAVERFLALEASGWKGQQETALLSRLEHADFFRDVCAAFRAAGRLQLLEFGTTERVVSGQCSLLAGDAVFHFKIAFDESAGHYRPGLQLELRMVDLFSEHMPQTWIDSCADPDSGLFRSFWPQRRRIGSYVIASNRAISWMIDHGAAHLGLADSGADAG